MEFLIQGEKSLKEKEERKMKDEDVIKVKERLIQKLSYLGTDEKNVIETLTHLLNTIVTRTLIVENN